MLTRGESAIELPVDRLLDCRFGAFIPSGHLGRLRYATKLRCAALAGTVSVLGFMIGYAPEFFLRLMGRLDGWAKLRAGQAGDTAKGPPPPKAN